MALANTTWDDYVVRGPAARRGAAKKFTSSLIMGAALVSCAAGGAYLLRLPGFLNLSWLKIPALERPAPLPLPLLEQNAVTFLRESLLLTGRSDRNLVRREVLAASRYGRLGPSSAPAPTAIRLQATFATRVSAQPAIPVNVPAAVPSTSDVAPAAITPAYQQAESQLALALKAHAAAIADQTSELAMVNADNALAQPGPDNLGTDDVPAAASPMTAAPAAAPAVPMPLPAPVQLQSAVAETVPADAAPTTAVPPIHISPSVVVPLPRSTNLDALAPANDKPAAVPAPAIASIPVTSVPAPPIGANEGTAIYDISAKTVYLPNGERLEAHSGLGAMTDNPRFVDRRNIGSTPPGTYELQSLDHLFFGVEALRLVPRGSTKTFGRDGFLTHTYLLRGRPGQSNGCVVFPEYQRFLDAYKRGHVKRLVVVASLKGGPQQVASAG